MRRRYNRTVTGRLTGLLAVLGLLLAACGGDSGLAVGDRAPAFELSDAAGGTVGLAEYEDQAVLLYFHMADG